MKIVPKLVWVLCSALALGLAAHHLAAARLERGHIANPTAPAPVPRPARPHSVGLAAAAPRRVRSGMLPVDSPQQTDGAAVVAADPEITARWIGGLEATELVRRLEELPGAELSGDTGQLLIRRWAELAPAEAGAWVMRLADATTRTDLATAMALAWSANDLSGSLTWAYVLPPGETQNRVLTALGFEVAREDPVAALRLAVELPAEVARDGLLLHALQEWTAQDYEPALAWALQLAPGSLRNQALAEVVTALAERDGNRAARLAVAEVLPGPDQDRAVVGILQRWVQHDRSGALAWVDAFPPIPLRDQALEAIAGLTSP